MARRFFNDKNMKVLVFTKDRPLQFRAYLESLKFCSDISNEQIYVILPTNKDYEDIIEEFDGIHWIFENNFENKFDDAFRYTVNHLIKDNDNVLFGCDDVIYIRPINLNQLDIICNDLWKNWAIGLSLRLGTNFAQQMQLYRNDNSKYSNVTISWRWCRTVGSFAYPWELMASIYQGSLIKRIVSDNKEKFLSPNYVESFGANWCWSNMSESLLVMMNSPSFACAADVNRVQTDFPNNHGGDEQHSPDILKEQYRLGKRLKWTNLFGITTDKIFTGRQFWQLI